jgi:tRNA nucleotidyltransferase (CCA-adding enzyme)
MKTHTEARPPATRWEHFPHAADMGVRGYGATRDQAFEQAALALSAIVTDLDSVRPQQAVEIHCEAPDDELLFVDWLNAIVYEMATRRMLFGRFEVRIEGSRLSATAYGEPLDVARHEPSVEIKGATYTALRVRPEPDGRWVAQTVVDV